MWVYFVPNFEDQNNTGDYSNTAGFCFGLVWFCLEFHSLLQKWACIFFFLSLLIIQPKLLYGIYSPFIYFQEKIQFKNGFILRKTVKTNLSNAC